MAQAQQYSLEKGICKIKHKTKTAQAQQLFSENGLQQKTAEAQQYFLEKRFLRSK